MLRQVVLGRLRGLNFIATEHGDREGGQNRAEKPGALPHPRPTHRLGLHIQNNPRVHEYLEYLILNRGDGGRVTQVKELMRRGPVFPEPKVRPDSVWPVPFEKPTR